jgi:hypothetical protein
MATGTEVAVCRLVPELTRSPGHWRAIRPGDQGSVTVNSGQSNQQVRPSGGVVLSDSQADSVASGSCQIRARTGSLRRSFTGTERPTTYSLTWEVAGGGVARNDLLAVVC